MPQNKWRSQYFFDIPFSFYSFGLTFLPKDSALNALQNYKKMNHMERETKKVTTVILKTSNINNFRARTRTSCIYVFSYRAIEANWTANCVELQKFYLISILKKFHNQNMLDKISITFSLNFLKNAFFPIIFRFLEKFILVDQVLFFGEKSLSFFKGTDWHYGISWSYTLILQKYHFLS